MAGRSPALFATRAIWLTLEPSLPTAARTRASAARFAGGVCCWLRNTSTGRLVHPAALPWSESERPRTPDRSQRATPRTATMRKQAAPLRSRRRGDLRIPTPLRMFVDQCMSKRYDPTPLCVMASGGDLSMGGAGLPCSASQANAPAVNTIRNMQACLHVNQIGSSARRTC